MFKLVILIFKLVCLFVLFSIQNIQKKSDKGYLVSRTGFATRKILFNVNY
jgi:hypothetical protein